MNSIAVITGAGSGIGQALTLELVKNHDIRVLGVGRRLSALQETQIHYPERIQIVAADVSEPEGRSKIIKALSENTKVRFLIHNAALLNPVAPLSEMDLQQWRRHQAVNVEAPLFLTQQLLPYLEGGRVLHISSGAAHRPYAGWGAYCVSKTSLLMMYKIWNMELAERNIRVGSVRPGVVNTPMQDAVREAKPEVFPALPKFLKLKEENQLKSPRHVARFISAVLLRTSDEDYAEQEWDIYNDEERFIEG